MSNKRNLRKNLAELETIVQKFEKGNQSLKMRAIDFLRKGMVLSKEPKRR